MNLLSEECDWKEALQLASTTATATATATAVLLCDVLVSE